MRCPSCGSRAKLHNAGEELQRSITPIALIKRNYVRSIAFYVGL
ncbi:Uncharacterised protein [Vibrio cholerae]|nr:Uncharacterised protein [Vibrio cholerae]